MIISKESAVEAIERRLSHLDEKLEVLDELDAQASKMRALADNLLEREQQIFDSDGPDRVAQLLEHRTSSELAAADLGKLETQIAAAKETIVKEGKILWNIINSYRDALEPRLKAKVAAALAETMHPDFLKHRMPELIGNSIEFRRFEDALSDPGFADIHNLMHPTRIVNGRIENIAFAR